MKIFVGMSGGVDSSVSALLLKNEGHNLTGVFIKTWQPDYIECTWKEDRLDAMRVCSQLDIPFITLDLEKEYKEGVIDYMLSEYENGRVPNPDVMCNREVKFGAFLKFAIENGADAIATGHYARIVKNKESFSLEKGKDDNKDQSYFLYQIKKENLNKIIFPIGDLEKSVVRSIAEKNNLYVADKPDSQGLCMLANISVKDFLKQELKNSDKLKVGNIIDENGKMLGSHDGVILYTVGERHGFEINNSGENNKPFFIIKKDIENNILIVSHDKPKNDLGGKIYLESTNYFCDIEKDKVYLVRSRYRGELRKVKVNTEENTVELLEEDLICVSGQSLVIYNEAGIVLGGGIIK